MKYIAFFFILSVATMVHASGINNNTESYDASMQQQFARSVSDRIFFDINSYSIRPEDIQVLSSLGSWLEKNDCDFIIEGHTDEQGTRNSSLVLGLRRAHTVFDYFLARGINSSRMKITSYGKEIPAVLGYDESAYSKNRRTVITLQKCTPQD